MNDINIVYIGTFGIVTDLGQSFEIIDEQTDASCGTLERYGVWFMGEVVHMTDDLVEATRLANSSREELSHARHH